MDEDKKVENLNEENVFSDRELIESLGNQLNQIKFFSDQVRFNSIIYEGLNIILQKLNNIEKKLNGDNK